MEQSVKYFTGGLKLIISLQLLLGHVKISGCIYVRSMDMQIFRVQQFFSMKF